MKDFDFRRMCRPINAFGKVREGILQKKMLIKYERSRYVYENKQISDIMPGKIRTFASNRHEFCRNSG